MYHQAKRCKIWSRDGDYHRYDGPAILHDNGDEEWYINGKRHREQDVELGGGPAVITKEKKEWYNDGKLHRIQDPAVIMENGTTKWYINGELHRDQGPAIIMADGTKKWYINGELHRDDLPAIESASKIEWWVNGKHKATEKMVPLTKSAKK
jgi:hypothetical protein